jgi:hypothetical protein
MHINPTPTTEEEAISLCIHLSAKFKFQVIFIQKADFEDQMGTEGWTDASYEYALEQAVEEVADQVGHAMDNAIETTNEENIG